MGAALPGMSEWQHTGDQCCTKGWARGAVFDLHEVLGCNSFCSFPHPLLLSLYSSNRVPIVDRVQKACGRFCELLLAAAFLIHPIFGVPLWKGTQTRALPGICIYTSTKSPDTRRHGRFLTVRLSAAPKIEEAPWRPSNSSSILSSCSRSSFSPPSPTPIVVTPQTARCPSPSWPAGTQTMGGLACAANRATSA